MEDFNKKSKTWDQDEERTQRAQAVANILKVQVPFTKEMTLLEYGCGTGLLSLNLNVPHKKMTLVDNSEGMLEQLQMKLDLLKDPTIEALKLDFSQIDHSIELYDVIYNLLVLHHIKDTHQIIDQFIAHLTPGGYLCIIDLEKEDGSFHGHGEEVHHGFNKIHLANLLISKGFTITFNQMVYSMVRESNGLPKTYTLFMLIGKYNTTK